MEWQESHRTLGVEPTPQEPSREQGTAFAKDRPDKEIAFRALHSLQHGSVADRDDSPCAGFDIRGGAYTFEQQPEPERDFGDSRHRHNGQVELL